MITWLTAMSRGCIIDVITALAVLAAGILECGDDMPDNAVNDCTALAVLAAGILEGGDDMADSTVKKLDYKYTYCISCTGSRHTGRW